ncbi:MAG: hypothetical protein ACC652_11790 [Acidimicrobiales bacterium]
MANPNPVRKLLILGGVRAKPEHREWLSDVLNDDDFRRRGLLLAVPNFVVTAVVAAVFVLGNDTIFGFVLFAIAIGVLVAGAYIQSLSKRRVAHLIKRNGL